MAGLSSPAAATDEQLQTSESTPQRIIARFRGTRAGPTLVCLTALHGNEPAGALAFERVAADIRDRNIEVAGELVGIRGNLAAIAAEQRFIDCDLNRQWTSENVARVVNNRESVASAEDHEMRALLAEFAEIEQTARGPLLAVDFHTTSAPSAPFCVVSDTLANRALAMHIPVPILLGLEEHIIGTLPTYLCDRGYVAFGFEGGMHPDERAVECCEAAIWITLASAGMIAEKAIPNRAEHVGLLRTAAAGLRQFWEVRQRHHVTDRDEFEMLPGFQNFDRVRWGRHLANDHGRKIRCEEDANILMPLYQGQGDDGFFVVRPVRRIWLAASKALRGNTADRVIRELPGIQADPRNAERLIVDTLIARFFVRDILHLLGYQKTSQDSRYAHYRKRDRGDKRTQTPHPKPDTPTA